VPPPPVAEHAVKRSEQAASTDGTPRLQYAPSVRRLATERPCAVMHCPPVLLTQGIVVVEHGLCGCGDELADARAERGENSCGGDPSGLGEVVAVSPGDLVNQPVGAQQSEFAAGPG